jgi:hypothetical protein
LNWKKYPVDFKLGKKIQFIKLDIFQTGELEKFTADRWGENLFSLERSFSSLPTLQ